MARNVNSIARCSTYKLCHIARFADYKIGSKHRAGQGRAGTEQGLCDRQLAGPGQFVESLAQVVSWAVGQVRVPHETGWSAMAKRRSPASRIDRPTDCLSLCPSVLVCVCVSSLCPAPGPIGTGCLALPAWAVLVVWTWGRLRGLAWYTPASWQRSQFKTRLAPKSMANFLCCSLVSAALQF